jgi:hypothetical protein
LFHQHGEEAQASAAKMVRQGLELAAAAERRRIASIGRFGAGEEFIRFNARCNWARPLQARNRLQPGRSP